MTKQSRAVLYARISQDDTGTGAGVTRQIEDTRALAEQRGWQIVHEFVDNDISAYSGAYRPAYQELMQLVDAGSVDRIIVYQTSRLWRSRQERANDMERLRTAHVSVAAVRGPELDLSSATGRMLAGILGEFDTAESEIKGERIARAAKQRAAQGRANGAVLYGWRRVYQYDDAGRRVGFTDEIDDAQADVVGRVVRSVGAGETLASIAASLTAEGVAPPGAKHQRARRAPDNPDGHVWGPSSVRKLATRPANVALRVSGQKVIGPAAWPAIVEQAEHDAAVEALARPGRRTSYTQHQRRHLLTFGIGRCGVCGFRLRVVTRAGHPMYACDSPRGCVGRRQSWVDDLVEGVIIERLKRDDAADLLAPQSATGADTDAVARVADLRKRLDDAADAYAAGKIDADQMSRISSKVLPDLEDAERRLAPLGPPPPTELRRMAGKRDARAVWRRLDINTKRAVMETLGVTVTLLPSKTVKAGPGFHPETVDIAWSTR